MPSIESNKLMKFVRQRVAEKSAKANPRSAVDPKLDPIERFKAARLLHLDKLAEADRTAGAAVLADLKERIRDHVGDDPLHALTTIRLLSRDPPVVELELPAHAPVRVTASGGSLAFHVLARGQNVATFDTLADALIHGGPLKFQARRRVTAPFDTRKGR
jgi:hypothetical protein